jgi:hypothetical protein
MDYEMIKDFPGAGYGVVEKVWMVWWCGALKLWHYLFDVAQAKAKGSSVYKNYLNFMLITDFTERRFIDQKRWTDCKKSIR